MRGASAAEEEEGRPHGVEEGKKESDVAPEMEKWAEWAALACAALAPTVPFQV